MLADSPRIHPSLETLTDAHESNLACGARRGGAAHRGQGKKAILSGEGHHELYFIHTGLAQSGASSLVAKHIYILG